MRRESSKSIAPARHSSSWKWSWIWGLSIIFRCWILCSEMGSLYRVIIDWCHEYCWSLFLSGVLDNWIGVERYRTCANTKPSKGCFVAARTPMWSGPHMISGSPGPVSIIDWGIWLICIFPIEERFDRDCHYNKVYSGCCVMSTSRLALYHSRKSVAHISSVIESTSGLSSVSRDCTANVRDACPAICILKIV